MKIIIYTFLILILLSLVYASDDQLQIISGDDELYFSQILDSETGVIFGNTETAQQNSQTESIVTTAGGSGTRKKTEQINKEKNNEEEKTQKEVIKLNTNLEPVKLKSLFDIRIEIDPKSKQSAKKEILSIVRLLNVGKEGIVETSIKYLIIDSKNNTILEETETVFVETQKEFIKRFVLPKNSTAGDYKLSTGLSYEDQENVAYSEDTFHLKNTEPKSQNKKAAVISLVIILFILSIIKLGKALYKRKKLYNYGKR